MNIEQKIFNDVCKHLIKQGQPSLSDENLCMYRGNGGTKCAVGFLIKDEYYRSTMEGKSADNPKVMLAVYKSLNIPTTVRRLSRLLSDLQSAHDSNARTAFNEVDRNYWNDQLKVRLRKIAYAHKLKIPRCIEE